MKLEAAIAEASRAGASKKLMYAGETFYIDGGELYTDEYLSDEAHLSVSEALSDGWSVVPVSRARQIDEAALAAAWNAARGTSSVKPAGQSEFYTRLISQLFGR